jgi:hypothetical protein
MKRFIFNTFIAGRIAKLFSGIKGYKTQVGMAVVVILTGVKYFAPVPVEYLPYIDQIIDMAVGGTGLALGDKIRRNYEIGKVMAEEVMNKLPTEVEQPK